MLGIRQKLTLGFGGLLATVAIIGLLTIAQIQQLDEAIGVILKENYRSVVACQDMKDALERMDSGVLISFAGRSEEGRQYIDENIPRFRAALAVELGNITLPGELAMTEQIARLFEDHTRAIPPVLDVTRSLDERKASYFSEMEPRFEEIKSLAQSILHLNQDNMQHASARAGNKSKAAYRAVLAGVVAATLIATLFSYLAHRWILKPVRRLIATTTDIRRGNLEVVIERGSRDEIGQLAESFNEMATSLRGRRAKDQLTLKRSHQATEEVFKVVPAAIAVLDLTGRVSVASETAQRCFGLRPGVMAQESGHAWLAPLLHEAMDREGLIHPEAKGERIQQFIGHREHFFEPWAIPIPAGLPSTERTGICVILKDVTEVLEQQELKRDVVATVSHQLKTPLTSLRMAIHLLLEEQVGTLTEKQTELLVGARSDADRLAGILDDLLDMRRIESGLDSLSLVAISPHSLAREAIEPFLAEAKDRGILLSDEVPSDLPEVMADTSRIQHAFGNLLSNALRFTQPGGTIALRAELEDESVRFSIEDTGLGIPSEHIGRLFAPFYRVPGQVHASGAGLGLAIVAEIVKAHGGRVGVESEVGRGSRFYFTLPVRRTTDTETN